MSEASSWGNEDDEGSLYVVCEGQYYLTIGYRKTSLDKHSAGLIFLGLITVSESQVVIQTTTFNSMMLHHAE